MAGDEYVVNKSNDDVPLMEEPVVTSARSHPTSRKPGPDRGCAAD